ncbi:hypothetical protein EK21DRAFT_117037 [Setomelanomma holmii]|uniref:Uncharacterized protein n=1 Tax=Setomelanomma holmii TaxID=210430 RepID=A0A9P4H178_9PLEO|nr:hypothetical protein EK21DRAFT_117037 [Setomelanomma holmii]
MNPQMANGQQGGFQHQSPQQSQNVGQQRQVPGGQQKPTQGQQQPQNIYANYDPQLILFILEKDKDVEGWIDVKPKKQHVPTGDLQEKLLKFRRTEGSVTNALDKIPSKNCRNVINDLVEDQNEELWKRNKTLKFAIAAVHISWREMKHRQRQLKRVQVILETEPSGIVDPQMMKSVGGNFGNSNNAQDVNKSLKQNNMGQGQQPGMNMGQQPRNPQQGQPMGQSQHFEQRAPPPPGGQGQMHGNAPPPPPPPPGGQQGHGGAPPPPPPPPGGAHPPPHGAHLPHGGMMPGAYPGAMPMHGRQGQPSIQVIDPHMMHNKKSKHHKSHHDESSSESSSSEWESESGSSRSSGSEPIRVRSVEHGDYDLVGKRKGSKHSSRKKHSRKHGLERSGNLRSRSISRHRSTSRHRSLSRPRSSRRRRHSDLIDPPPMGRHSASSSRPNSPKIAPINIFMHGNNSSGDERGHRHGKTRERRNSMNMSPTRRYNKQKLEKINLSHPMARGDSSESWQSWAHGSDTASFATSSAHTDNDGIFDAPVRPRGHGRTHSYSHQNQRYSTSPRRYEDLDRRGYTTMKTRADDYPHASPPRGRGPYAEPAFSGRPLPHRRNTTQGHPNPFAPAPILHRSNTQQPYNYGAEMHQPDYAYQQQGRYLADRPAEVDELADALYERMKMDNQRGPPMDSQRVPLRRPTLRRDSGIIEDDEWDARHPLARRGTYY